MYTLNIEAWCWCVTVDCGVLFLCDSDAADNNCICCDEPVLQVRQQLCHWCASSHWWWQSTLDSCCRVNCLRTSDWIHCWSTLAVVLWYSLCFFIVNCCRHCCLLIITVIVCIYRSAFSLFINMRLSLHCGPNMSLFIIAITFSTVNQFS